MNKSRLNEFCQQKGWGLPMYSCIKDGEDHDPHFRASVLVNGFTFTSQNVSKSSKSAHNEAAKIALSYFLYEEAVAAENLDIGAKKLPYVDSSHSDINLDISSKNGDVSSPTLSADETKENLTPASVLPISPDPQATNIPPQMMITPPDLSALSISEPKPQKSLDSYLLGNKVRVYTFASDMDLPKGTVMLPIDDNKWAVVSLEFSNEITA